MGCGTFINGNCKFHKTGKNPNVKKNMHDRFYHNCRFSYAGNWELVKSIVGSNFRRSHMCLQSQAGNRLWQLMAVLVFVIL